MMRLNRRLFVRAAAVALGTCVAFTSFAQDAKKKVLFLTKSQGFQHSVITRNADDWNAPAHAEKWLKEFGGKAGYDVSFTKDASVFNDPKTYETYQVVAFYTTGDLTREGAQPAYKKNEQGRLVVDRAKTFPEQGMSKEGKEMLIKAIQDGKVGYLGFHCASDTFHSPRLQQGELMYDAATGKPTKADPYINLVGGEFQSHGSQQKSNMKVVSKEFPGLTDLADFELTEEWYAHINIAPDLHVILAQDTETMKKDAQGKREWQYDRPNFPATWARKEGNGRVFYTSMGHREDVWENPIFQKVVIAGLDWASGKTKFDAKPNIKTATPEYQTAGAQAPRPQR